MQKNIVIVVVVVLLRVFLYTDFGGSSSRRRNNTIIVKILFYITIFFALTFSALPQGGATRCTRRGRRARLRGWYVSIECVLYRMCSL